jgi:hypothetical protein
LWAASGLFQTSEEAIAGCLTLSLSKSQEYAERFEALRKPWMTAHGWNHGKWDEIMSEIIQSKSRCLGVFFFTSFLEYVRERLSSMKDISGLEAQVNQWRPCDASGRLEQQLLLKEMRIGRRTRELPSWTGVVSDNIQDTYFKTEGNETKWKAARREKNEGSKEREEKEEVIDLTQSSEDEEMPDPPGDSAEDGERSESEIAEDVGPQGSSKMASGGEEDRGGDAGGGEAGGGEACAGPSEKHAGVRQAATAIMMGKALSCFAKGIKVREDAKKFLKDRARTFLGQFLCRDELAGSMDPKMVASAIAGWIPEHGDIGERMRSVPPSPPTVICLSEAKREGCSYDMNVILQEPAHPCA